MNLPGLVKFDYASPDDIAKVIKISPTKSCLLDPWPTFLVKDCLDILLPSITKLVNCSLSEGAVPDGFKSAVVNPLINKSSLSRQSKELSPCVWAELHLKTRGTCSCLTTE